MESKLRIVFLSISLGIALLVSIFYFIFQISFLGSLFFVLTSVLVVSILWFLHWSLRPMGRNVNVDDLLADGKLSITRGKYGSFLQRAGENPENGIIFYPGGRVVPEAYLSLLKKIVVQKCPVYLVKMPFNMAVFDHRRALKVMKEKPEIKNWIIGGHSLGGAMAVHVLREKPEEYKGLFLWGAYPSHRDDISDMKFPILAIFGTCDGITPVEKIEASRHLFPSHTHWLKLEGGNHAQFGCYGSEKQDHLAEISMQDQQRVVIESTLAFLDGICQH